jgi:peptide/nickel transport system substrate-binding protein
VDGKPPAGIAYHKWFYNYSDYMSLNARRPPFKDVRVRQAVRYTLDREALNAAIYFGLGEVHNQPFKKASHWYLDVPTTKPDLARARKLMQEAGLGGGLEITMLVWAPAYEKRAEVVQAQLAQIGIRARLDKRDVANFIKHLSTYEWDMATLVIGTIFHPDRPYGYFSSEHSSHPYVGGYDTPELDALLSKARDETDFTKAKAIYKTVLEKHVEEVGTPLYLMNLPLIHAFRDFVKGYDAYGYDLVSINGAMGLHKTWVAK